MCAVRGFRATMVTSDAFSREKRDHMRALGAEVVEIPSDGGRITRELIQGMMSEATERSRSPDSVLADQFNNVDAIAGYRPLGDEIWAGAGGRIDAFVQAVGTAQGDAGGHGIEGVGPGFVPPLWSAGIADEVLRVSTAEAKAMNRRLAKEEGPLSTDLYSSVATTE